MEIKTLNFTSEDHNSIVNGKKSKNWPVVYLLRDQKEIYIGETNNFAQRFLQHLNNSNKKHLRKIDLILGSDFNKSATLDIEQALIRLFSADGQLNVLNLNGGQSANNDYFQRERYEKSLEDIWKRLVKMKLARKQYLDLINSEIFKYSPYISLTNDQLAVSYQIINNIVHALRTGENITNIINGGAGTGKTIVAINIIFQIVQANTNLVSTFDDEEFTDFESKTISNLRRYIKEFGKIKIGFIVPMKSLRMTLSRVFSKTRRGLSGSQVIGPSDLKNEHYDVLFVDETHRLSQRKNITNMGNFDLICHDLGLNPTTSSQLDWVIAKSKTRVLFYDRGQTIKGSDIDANEFDRTTEKTTLKSFFLESQMRSKGGNLFIDYISKLLNCTLSEKIEFSDNYDFRLYHDVEQMYQAIKRKNIEMKLCRMISGYSWKWNTKNKKGIPTEKLLKQGIYDIDIDGKRYIWNRSDKEYILKEDSINEIGCVHTTQGYDLNYVGLIFGREIDYNYEKNCIQIDLSKFCDTNVKKDNTREKVEEYIINSYKVMLSRGIKGCYVYAYNKNLRNYLAKYVTEAKTNG